MKHVVITYVLESDTSIKDGREMVRHSKTFKSVIPCRNAIEAEDIATVMRGISTTRHGHEERISEPAIQLYDIDGKAGYFTLEYFEHVMSDLTEPNFKVAAE